MADSCDIISVVGTAAGVVASTSIVMFARSVHNAAFCTALIMN